jgi:hypothetical protein
MSRTFSKMDPSYNNINDALRYITGNIQYFNMPSTPDQLLSLDQILENYKLLDAIENTSQTTFFARNNTDDDYLAVAFSAGASNFLRANGFPDIYPYYIDKLQDIATKLPYPVNIDFSSQITPSPAPPTQAPMDYQPTKAPLYQPKREPLVYQPTQGPVVYQPTQSPVVYQPTQADNKNDTLKKVYISLLLGCILLIISIPFVYNKSNLLIFTDLLVCFTVSFVSVFTYYKLR